MKSQYPFVKQFDASQDQVCVPGRYNWETPPAPKRSWREHEAIADCSDVVLMIHLNVSIPSSPSASAHQYTFGKEICGKKTGRTFGMTSHVAGHGVY